ncbi:alpha/beta-tubulin-N-acetyltransferase 9 [Epargyreus clarus]|uniref:alpha/beta-tubulin-N-acetyltransferase 9 n=1 Tax=Epargyreus clarus TaxID=520877 RepID=UPI003C2F6096
MKINANIKIIGQNVILVPYRECHVSKYHKWMTSEELLKLTGSEPLTLDQEYDMQRKWREDDDKCTFIILDKAKFDITNDEIGSMIGDTNIFIIDKNLDHPIGEIEIMIAEESARGKKFGWEAVILMMLYGIKYINLCSYEAKILLSNTISIKMFEKLGFTKTSISSVFEEVTMEKNISEDWVDWLEKQYQWQIKPYE